MENNRITLVLVDTCAYRDANSDFPGILKRLLPSFFSTVKEKRIVLLTHPILENEIYKHIEDSGLYKDYQALVTQLNRCNETLKYIQCYNDILFSKICDMDIKKQLLESYRQHYNSAIRLDYGNPAEVFENYFNGNPPFAISGKKKNEFPDAFVFNATKKFLEKHPNDVLLIVSKDNDWKNAFEKLDNTVYCESISDALTRISSIDSVLSEEMINQIFMGAYKEIIN